MCIRSYCILETIRPRYQSIILALKPMTHVIVLLSLSFPLYSLLLDLSETFLPLVYRLFPGRSFAMIMRVRLDRASLRTVHRESRSVWESRYLLPDQSGLICPAVCEAMYIRVSLSGIEAQDSSGLGVCLDLFDPNFSPWKSASVVMM
jgi:hypothetical protein